MTDVLARRPLAQSRPVFNAGGPALGDLDGDEVADIAFACENALYLLKMVAADGGTLTSLVPSSIGPSLPLGSVPDDRLFTDEPMPQALIADIDHDGRNEALAHHYGDGAVWAYNDVDSLAAAATRYVPGFPLRTFGEVRNACRITDLENDGVLDLVLADNAGYVFSAALDTGAAYEQPWSGPWGNNWNTGTGLYRDAGNAGHLYESWTAPNGTRTPYRWFETGYFNGLTESGNNFVHDNGVLRTNAINGRNYHFTGPGMKGLSNYTVRGTFKFDVDTVEFGINFYSQWPNEARKYTLMRERDGLLRLYYYSGPNTRVQLGDALDTSSVGAHNDAAVEVGVWYNYEIMVRHSALDTTIRAFCWRGQKPSQPGIEVLDAHLTGGLVGFVAHQYVGAKYWGPITVTSNEKPTPATITVEDFHKDSLADVMPHVSENWHPDYRYNRFELSTEVNGFVMDTTSGRPPVLTYSHKPGVEYPVTCRLIPETNLQWKDYRFTGTIVKPDQPAWDTVSVGIVFYYQGEDSCYKVLFERGGCTWTEAGSTIRRLVRLFSGLVIRCGTKSVSRPMRSTAVWAQARRSN